MTDAPKPGCRCNVCRWLRRDDDYVPVVTSRDPYYGELRRRGEVYRPDRDAVNANDQADSEVLTP